MSWPPRTWRLTLAAASVPGFSLQLLMLADRPIVWIVPMELVAGGPIRVRRRDCAMLSAFPNAVLGQPQAQIGKVTRPINTVIPVITEIRFIQRREVGIANEALHEPFPVLAFGTVCFVRHFCTALLIFPRLLRASTFYELSHVQRGVPGALLIFSTATLAPLPANRLESTCMSTPRACHLHMLHTISRLHTGWRLDRRWQIPLDSATKRWRVAWKLDWYSIPTLVHIKF